MGESWFMKSERITYKPMDKQRGVFQSLVRFTSGNEELAAGLAHFSSFNNKELNDKSLKLLHPEEIKTGVGYASDIRRKSYIHGRIAGKMAVSQVFPDIKSAYLQIAAGCMGKPLLQNIAWPYGISIAHDDLWNAGLCFPLSVPMGIDVETITEKNRKIIPSILSDHEKEMCSRVEDSLEFLHLLWTAKEAAGKAIGLGFRVPTEWYEIEFVETLTTEPQLIRQCRFKQLSVFTALSTTIPHGILSIAFPAENNLSQTMIRLLQ
jgi:phosphopantetheine--protein transferase-like protein